MPRASQHSGTTPDPAVSSVHADDANDASIRELHDAFLKDIDKPHPGGARVFACAPWMRNIPIVGRCLESFGPSVTASLFIINFTCKGNVYAMLNTATQPMLVNRLGASAIQYQRLSPLARLGGSLKASAACFTDTFAFFHYTKRWYLLGCTILSAVFCIVFGALPTNKASSLNTAGAMMFLTAFFSFTIDILVQGHYSRLIKRRPSHASALVTWVYIALPAGNIMVAVVEGPLSDAGLPHVGLFISGALAVAGGFVYIVNWLEENHNKVDRHNDAVLMHEEKLRELRKERELRLQTEAEAEKEGLVATGGVEGEPAADGLNDDELVLGSPDERGDVDPDFVEPRIIPICGPVIEVNAEVVQRNLRLVLYSILMSVCVVVLLVVTLLADKWGLLYTMIVVAAVANVAAYFALPLALAKACTYLFFGNLLYLSLPGAINTFYLAKRECIADAPHFSYTFFNIVGTCVGNIGTMAGGVVFTYFLANRKYVFTANLCLLLKIFTSLFDLMLVMRWNIVIGIPDHVVYIFGASVVFDLCDAMASMPMTILMSRLCPRGSESMVYALLASMGNIGGTMSGTVGSVIMETRLPVHSEAPNCDFTNVKWLIIIGHICVPLLLIPLHFILLPNARVCDEIDGKGRTIKRMEEERMINSLSDSDKPTNTDNSAEDAKPAAAHREGETGENIVYLFDDDEEHTTKRAAL